MKYLMTWYINHQAKLHWKMTWGMLERLKLTWVINEEWSCVTLREDVVSGQRFPAELIYESIQEKCTETLVHEVLPLLIHAVSICMAAVCGHLDAAHRYVIKQHNTTSFLTNRDMQESSILKFSGFYSAYSISAFCVP